MKRRSKRKQPNETGPTKLNIKSVLVTPLPSGGHRVEIYAGKRSEQGKGERLALTILPGKVQARIDFGSYKPNGARAIVSMKKLRIAYPKMIESGIH